MAVLRGIAKVKVVKIADLWLNIANFEGMWQKKKTQKVGKFGKCFFFVGCNGKGVSALLRALYSTFSYFSPPPPLIPQFHRECLLNWRITRGAKHWEGLLQ